MSERCAECGAILPEGHTCQTIFNECLILEYANPEYGQVHFLTVSCFMIQHGRYSDEALAWIRGKLQIYLEQQLTNEQLRRLVAIGMSNSTHTWKILRQPDADPLPEIAWSMTIADLVPAMQDATTYCEKIKQWANITLNEMKSVE